MMLEMVVEGLAMFSALVLLLVLGLVVCRRLLT